MHASSCRKNEQQEAFFCISVDLSEEKALAGLLFAIGKGGEKRRGKKKPKITRKNFEVFPCLAYNINLNPFIVASPGREFIAPWTGSPRSSFLFKRPRTMRKTVAAMMAINAVPQLTLMATTVRL